MSFYWIPRMSGYITCVIIKTSPSSSKHQDFYKMVSGTVVNLFRIKKINNPCKHFKSSERPSVIVNQFHTLTTWADWSTEIFRHLFSPSENIRTKNTKLSHQKPCNSESFVKTFGPVKNNGFKTGSSLQTGDCMKSAVEVFQISEQI